MRDTKRTEDDEGQREINERLKSEIDVIVKRLHEKKVQVREKFEVSFVDREGEARKILEGVAGIWLLGGTVVLYGPKGCGKSTFFEKLVESIREASESGETYFEASYVKWDEAEKAVKAMGSGDLSEVIFDAIKSLDPSVSLEGGVVTSASLSLGRFFGRVIEAVSLSRKAKKYGRVLLVMDERKIENENDSMKFRSELEDLADNVRRANLKYYQEKRGHITAVILTSDALAAKAWQRIGTKVAWLLMWSLPRDAFEKLADQLGISVERDLLWNLTEGNPRALGDILESGLGGWLASFVGNKVVDALMPYWKLDPEQTMRAVREVVENPDELGAWRKPLSPPLGDIFLEGNIAIRIVGLPGPITELPREPWIGERYAFQLPAYYYTLRAIAEKGDLKITPEDVIREAKEASNTRK